MITRPVTVRPSREERSVGILTAALKTLADFDFSFQPSIKREQIDALHELGVVVRAFVKKTQRTPKREIALVLRRAGEISK